MEIIDTGLPGVLLLRPTRFGDHRGFFLETFSARRYAEAGIPGLGAGGEPLAFVQDNHSRSGRGVLRGLHFQKQHPQGKLVSVARGSVYDVAVDVRLGSPHFGKWVGYELSDENAHQLWVPPGFAHGFCVLSETADFLYKCTDYYTPGDEGGVRWDDPAIGIEWPIDSPQLSGKDAVYRPLSELAPEDLPATPAAPTGVGR